jgi:hypothetical protein
LIHASSLSDFTRTLLAAYYNWMKVKLSKTSGIHRKQESLSIPVGMVKIVSLEFKI